MKYIVKISNENEITYACNWEKINDFIIAENEKDAAKTVIKMGIKARWYIVEKILEPKPTSPYFLFNPIYSYDDLIEN